MTNTITLPDEEARIDIAYWLKHVYGIDAEPKQIITKYQNVQGSNVYKGFEIVTPIEPVRKPIDPKFLDPKFL